ncbi:MAG TPA: hypothetical protein VHO90_21620 [Bacteroidales bacterium]|nr:hypothetical protein [Bacteroidales bacterium]
MARMLYLRDSASFMLNAVRRHRRLCNKISYGAPYSEAILSAATSLDGKYKLFETASNNREDAYDDVILADDDLDNTIHNAFDSCSTYERKHPGQIFLKTIFLKGTYSDITRMRYPDEPNEADKVAARIENLGNAHELYPLAATIRTSTASVRTALNAYEEAIRLEKAADAEVEIKKLAVVRTYEGNYLDARKNHGKENAERLFPKLSIKKEEEGTEETPANSGK